MKTDENDILDFRETADLPGDYPNSHYDPDPISRDATALEINKYKEDIHELGVKMLETYSDLGFTGEELWEEFISVFRPCTIKNWDISLLTRWISYLSKNDIYIEKGRNKNKAQKLIDILFREKHISNSDMQTDDIPTSDSNLKRRVTEFPRRETATHLKQNYIHTGRDKILQNSEDFQKSHPHTYPTTEVKQEQQNPKSTTYAIPEGSFPSDDEDSDTDGESNKKRETGGLRSIANENN